MKQRCQNDFRCTFQMWLGSCRCSLHAGASQKPGGQAECSVSDVRFSCAPALIEKNYQTVILTCELYIFLHAGVVGKDVRRFKLRLWFRYLQLWCTTFAHMGSCLVNLAGVRKFLSAFFHWKGTCGLGEGERVCFGCVCVFLSVYKRTNVRGTERERKSETQCLFKPACVCLISVSVCVCVCVCLCVCMYVFGRGDWAGVRDSDGVERVWCTVITLSGMWLSWELLALGTWANKLLFKGQLPSLYRLLFFPPLCPPTSC